MRNAMLEKISMSYQRHITLYTGHNGHSRHSRNSRHSRHSRHSKHSKHSRHSRLCTFLHNSYSLTLNNIYQMKISLLKCICLSILVILFAIFCIRTADSWQNVNTGNFNIKRNTETCVPLISKQITQHLYILLYSFSQGSILKTQYYK